MAGIALWLLLSSRPPADGLKPVTTSVAATGSSSSFEHTVRPILEAHCQPCHFSGGKMYERLPFDRPETIVKLNTKLFTRIKNEQERAAIRQFLGTK